ncbi:MAG: acylneuraminate cytidylyltransferase family protein [Proteobacteria bacterium]|nr:acylneuraminate cytidylyltransferase family protein [Pseudomonadota bacterium]
MRVLGIIPARAGSKRLPRKNLRLLGGRPLVDWVLGAARAARALDRLIVSSDDEEVLSLAREHDPALPLRRPSELAGDTSPAIDYVQHALRALEAGGDRFDAVAIIQPSSPFTQAGDIDGTVALLLQSGAASAVSIVELDHAIHPLKLKRLEGDRLLPYLEEERGRMAAHELPRLFVRNCSVYVSRRAVIDGGAILGEDCRGFVMPAERSVDINTGQDLLFAEFLLQRAAAGGAAR